MLIQVKDNQENLVNNIEDIIRFCKPDAEESSLEKSRGRIENRLTKAYSGPEMKEFIDDKDWKGYILVVLWVMRQRETKDKKTGLWVQTVEHHYYIASSAQYTITQLHQAVRHHWSIENKNHYVRDVTLKEDASTIRTKPTLMARIRSFALNIMKANGEKNIAEATFCNALNINRIRQYKYVF